MAVEQQQGQLPEASTVVPSSGNSFDSEIFDNVMPRVNNVVQVALTYLVQAEANRQEGEPFRGDQGLAAGIMSGPAGLAQVSI